MRQHNLKKYYCMSKKNKLCSGYKTCAASSLFPEPIKNPPVCVFGMSLFLKVWIERNINCSFSCRTCSGQLYFLLRVIWHHFQYQDSKRDEVIGGWKRLNNEELHKFYFSSKIWLIKSRIMRWAENVAHMGRREIRIGFWSEIRRKRTNREDLTVSSCITLKWIV